MKIMDVSAYSKVMSITTWTKFNGVTADAAPFNWATIYTYTTNATATVVTNWIGAAISTSPNIPNTIDGQPVIVTASSTFNAKTTVTNCYIGANVAFSSNSMVNAFSGCTSLIGVDLIPNSVTTMYQTFRECTKLVNAPTIPNSVTNMAYTFWNCSVLVNAPTIGVNVTNMRYTFFNCVKLVGNITVVNTGVTTFLNCFYGCNASLAKNLRCPTGSASYNLAINVCNGINGVTVVAY